MVSGEVSKPTAVVSPCASGRLKQAHQALLLTALIDPQSHPEPCRSGQCLRTDQASGGRLSRPR